MRRPAFAASLAAMLVFGPAPAAQLDLHDAQRFARMFAAADGRPDAQALQQGYLDGGSPVLAAYVPDYIGNAEALAKAVDAAPQRYRHGIDACLPLFAGLGDFVQQVQLRHRALVPDARAVDVVPLFGTGGSAGTVIDERIVLGVEKVCDGVDTDAALRERLQGLVAHEWVHTRQPGLREADRRDLLVWALREGVANYLGALALGKPADGPENAWALAREAKLWRQFQRDRATMRAHWPRGGDPDPRAVEAGTRWMWNSAAADGRPADLAYWIGQRIAASWFSIRPDKIAAARELIRMRSPEAIVAQSGYAP